MFYKHTILSFWLFYNKQTFQMFSLFMLCPHDVDVQRGQRIMGFFILTTHKSLGSENPITWTKQILHTPSHTPPCLITTLWISGNRKWGRYLAVCHSICVCLRRHIFMRCGKWKYSIEQAVWGETEKQYVTWTKLTMTLGRINRGKRNMLNKDMATKALVAVSSFPVRT